MDIVVFYHVYQHGSWWNMYKEQIDKLVHSDLEASAKAINIRVNGDDRIVYKTDKMTIRYNADHRDEKGTLKALRNYCLDNDCYVLYMHTKGISRLTPYTEDWRRMMEYFTIERWQDCIDALRSGYDCAGSLWQRDTFQGDKPHFSGNFWWAKSKYIRTLDDSYLESHNRFDREFWIGTGNPRVRNFHESGLNTNNSALHYHVRYERHNYAKD